MGRRFGAPRGRLRRIARIFLTVLLVCSLMGSGYHAWKLMTNPVAAVFVARSVESTAARLDRVVSRHATADGIESRLEALLEEDRREWIRIDALIVLADEEAIALDPDLLERAENVRRADHGLATRLNRCGSCLIDIADCDLALVFYCRGPVEMTPLGDVASILRQSGLYVTGGDVDEVELALATIGLGAVALVPVTGGQAYTIKAGATLAKTAHRMAALPPAAVAAARRAATEGIDWSVLARASPGQFRPTLRAAVQPAAVGPAVDFMRSTGELRRTVGAAGTLLVLRRVQTIDEARGMARAAAHLERRTLGAVEVAGVSRLVRATLRLGPEIYRLIAGLAAALLALLALVLSSLQTAFLRWLRKLARKERPDKAVPEPGSVSAG
jgi:hypothetical protein